jgi:type IV pilus assembly protein PilW
MGWWRVELKKKSGFSLVELLVAIVVGGIIISAAYMLFISNQRTYIIQDELVNIQQTIRPAAEYMGRYIRIAGLDPEQTNNFGITNATNETIEFSFDRLDSGLVGVFEPTNERKQFRALNGQLQEMDQATNAWVAIAENVEVLNFVYLNSNGNVITNPSANLAAIRTVEISIVGVSRNPVPRYTNTISYVNLQGTEILAPQNDNFVRMMFSETVQCRNLGL